MRRQDAPDAIPNLRLKIKSGDPSKVACQPKNAVSRDLRCPATDGLRFASCRTPTECPRCGFNVCPNFLQVDLGGRTFFRTLEDGLFNHLDAGPWFVFGVYEWGFCSGWAGQGEVTRDNQSDNAELVDSFLGGIRKGIQRDIQANTAEQSKETGEGQGDGQFHARV